MNNHKLIQDLFPSYIDKLTSEETNEFIEDHIKDCDKCNEILKKMRTEVINQEHTDLKSKKINFAKKLNLSLKLLKMIICIIFIIIFIGVINFNRKAFILKRLQSLGNSYQNINNYVKICVNSGDPAYYQNLSDTSIMKYYYKDGNSIITRSDLCATLETKDKFVSNKKTKEYLIDGKKYKVEYDYNGNISKFEETIDTIALNEKIETYASYIENGINDRDSLIIVNPLELAIKSKIKTVMFDGIECYSIEINNRFSKNENAVFYFEKATGLLRKVKNEEYYYYFDVVSDDIFELPEVPDKRLE